MSIYTIKSSTLNRIASVCSFFHPTTSETMKKALNTVRLENKGGKTFAIASNQKIGVVEYLGETDEPDSGDHIILSDGLLQQLFMEAASDHSMTITTVPEMAISTLQSSSGFTFVDCCYWWENIYLKEWQTWGVESPKANSGIMRWDLDYVESLMKSSPSNNIIFPRFINVKVPIVLRDFYNPNWVGVFLASKTGVETTVPAELPEWWSL